MFHVAFASAGGNRLPLTLQGFDVAMKGAQAHAQESGEFLLCKKGTLGVGFPG